MVVCAHGDVQEYCAKHGLLIGESWDGDLDSYSGRWPVLVSDQIMDEKEYYALKLRLLRRGVELISTHCEDDPRIVGILTEMIQQDREKYGNRQIFGFRYMNGEVVEIPEMIVVARLVLRLRDAGASLREIADNPEVRAPNGRKLSISTISKITKNRGRYDDSEATRSDPGIRRK